MGLWPGPGNQLQKQRYAHPSEPSTPGAGQLQLHPRVLAPLVGIATRQGRRFTMEDRTAYDSGLLLPGPGSACGPANYTFAAGG